MFRAGGGEVYWLSITDHIGQRGKPAAIEAIMADKVLAGGKGLLKQCFAGYEHLRSEYVPPPPPPPSPLKSNQPLPRIPFYSPLTPYS